MQFVSARGLATARRSVYRMDKYWAAPIRVVNQAALLNGPSVMQGLLQGIEHKVRLDRPRDPPADDAISESC
jgi:hypothetical protein